MPLTMTDQERLRICRLGLCPHCNSFVKGDVSTKMYKYKGKKGVYPVEVYTCSSCGAEMSFSGEPVMGMADAEATEKVMASEVDANR